jgi:hypothetical protein
MNNLLNKSERRRPREIKYYPTMEACVQAKTEEALKFLEGVDLSPVFGPGYERFTSKTLPHSPSSPVEKE